jgi:hypothetical protein
MSTTEGSPATSSADEVLAADQVLRKVTVSTGGRFLAAYLAAQNFNVVTQPPPPINNTQRWLLRRVGTGAVTIQELSSGRYLDALDHFPFSRPLPIKGEQQQPTLATDRLRRQHLQDPAGEQRPHAGGHPGRRLSGLHPAWGERPARLEDPGRRVDRGVTSTSR